MRITTFQITVYSNEGLLMQDDNLYEAHIGP
jgi:hypothetical protein